MIDYRENNKWTVYIHISPSNKYYVGITSQKRVNGRWKNGKGYKKNPHFTRAIKKYGWDNFQHEIFAEHLTKDEACNMEITLIKVLKANDYHYGYNICSGGEGATGLYGEKNHNYGKHWTDEQKKRMSNMKKGKHVNLSEEGRKHKAQLMNDRWADPEYREKMTGENAPAYGKTGEKHPLYGKRGAQCAGSKKVICLNTKEVFVSAKAACENKHCNHSKLCMCCRGERKSCGKDENGNNLHWMFYTDYLKKNNLTDSEARKSLFFVE